MLTIKKYYQVILLLVFYISTTFTGFAQIGIGTVSPNASSVLDITSTTKGLLTPRMSTTQRLAITSPADGLIVYDTDLKLFYYYSAPTWNPLNSTASGRLNFKRIKSTDVLATVLAAEKTAGGNSKYLLNTNTLYEINGTVNFDLPIDLNNAYLTGQDANEDIINSTATAIFQGNTGGSMRFLTLKGLRAFNITGPGLATNSSLLIQNVVIDGMTTSVGSISGLGLFFGNIIQFINNANGITYSNIGNLLLNNQAWLSTNNGTFETFYGTFGLIEKNSGFSTLDGSDVAIDVTGTLGTLTVGTGTLLGTVFSGATTNSTGYIKGYAAASTYPGYYFSNVWTIDSPGIPREGDSDATGDINFTAAVGAGVTTSFTGTGSSSRTKINGATTSNNLFRFGTDGTNSNRIYYRGTKTRYFQVTGSVSYQGTGSDLTLILYIARNGVVLTDTKVYGRPSTGFLSTSGILALPIVGTVQLKTNEYIEIWAERYDGSGNISTVSLNLTAK